MTGVQAVGGASGSTGDLGEKTRRSIFQTHAAHITSSIVKVLLFHIAGLCLLMASLELIQDRGLMANLTPSPEDYF